MKKVIIVMVVFSVILGISLSVNARKLYDEEKHQFKTIRFGSLYIFEFKLTDGTQCVVNGGSFTGGISCDWNGNKKPKQKLSSWRPVAGENQ